MSSSTTFVFNNETTTPIVPLNPTQNALKAVLILTLFFITFLASLLAFALRNAALTHRHSAFTKAFSYISCFGAGVFLATCLLDLFADSLEDIQKALKEISPDGEFKFPITELCVAVGFMLVLFIEQTIVYASEKGWIGSSEVQRLLSHDEEHIIPDSAIMRPEPDSVDVESEHDPHFEPATHSTMRAVLLVFALSLHAVFEGLSVGLIPEVSVLFQLFAALAIHKSVVGFSLGIRLVQSQLRKFTVIMCCAIFAGQVLLGGFIGLAITNALKGRSSAVTNLISGILQAIACGTFLYITSFEILPHELNQRGHRPLKMLFLVIGFALIAAFIAIFPETD